MRRDSSDITPQADDMFQRERIRYQWMLESIQKFRVFFAGLVFAMLAFSIQFSIESPSTSAMWLQIAAWICLLLTGLLALRDAGGFVLLQTENKFSGLVITLRVFMWLLFVAALVLLAIARILATYPS